MKLKPQPTNHDHRFVLQVVQPGLLGLMDGSVLAQLRLLPYRPVGGKGGLYACP